MRSLMSDDVVWHVPSRNLLSRDYTGPAEVAAFFGRVRELAGGTARPQVLEVMAGDQYATAIVRMYAEREGKKLDGSLQAWTCRISGGKIAESWFLVDDRYAVDAFWS